MTNADVPTALSPAVAEIARVAGLLWQRGWAERNAGNLSLDVTDAVGRDGSPTGAGRRVGYASAPPALVGRSLLVTAAGARFRDLAESPADGLLLIRVVGDASAYAVDWAGPADDAAPTSELASHLRMHAALRAAESPHRAVLHTHPTHLIALTHAASLCRKDALSRLLWSMLPEISVFLPEGIGLAPYRCPGGEALAQVTVAALARHRVVIWEKHGCVAVERTLIDAFDLIDALEKAARIFVLCRAAGFHPQGHSDEALGGLTDLAHRLRPGAPPRASRRDP